MTRCAALCPETTYASPRQCGKVNNVKPAGSGRKPLCPHHRAYLERHKSIRVAPEGRVRA